MAIAFGAFGLFVAGNPFLVFIAIFVYLGAQAEAQMVELTTLLRGMDVRDAMQTHFRTLSADDSLALAVDQLLAGSQQDFPVLDDAKVVGILRRQDLVKALAEHGRTASVGSAMCRECQPAAPHEALERAFERLQQRGCTAVAVIEDGRLIGVLTLENISEFVMVNSALEKNSPRAN